MFSYDCYLNCCNVFKLLRSSSNCSYRLSSYLCRANKTYLNVRELDVYNIKKSLPHIKRFLSLAIQRYFILLILFEKIILQKFYSFCFKDLLL